MSTTTPDNDGVPAAPERTAPPASAHYRTAVVVAVVVAIVAVAGGIGLLLGGGREELRPPDRDPADLVLTPPDEVAPPDEVDLPGPQPGNLRGSLRQVSGAQTPPGLGQDLPGGTTQPIPETGDTTTTSEVDDPGTDEDTTTTTEVDDPGTDEDTTTTTEAEDPDDPEDPGNEDVRAVRFPGDVVVQIPDGWRFIESADGDTLFTTDGAALTIGVWEADETITADRLLELASDARAESLSPAVFNEPAPIAANVDNMTGASGRGYSGFQTSQNGTTVVEGDILAFTTDFGYGYTITTVTESGEYDPYIPEFQAFISSLTGSIGTVQ